MVKKDVYIFEKLPLGGLIESRLLAKFPPTVSNVQIHGIKSSLDKLNINTPMDEIPDSALFSIALAFCNSHIPPSQSEKSLIICHVNSEEGLNDALAIAPLHISILARLSDKGANRHDLDLVRANALLSEANIKVLSSYIGYLEILPLQVSQMLQKM